MQYARTTDNNRVEATPNVTAFCECCNSEVIPKCGTINIWHFAHKADADCDPWYEPESKWHRDWKANFSPECREVVIGKHRADIKTKGLVIELQNSPISAEEIKEREQFYGNMIWIINAEAFWDNFFIGDKENYSTFYWKHGRKCWGVAKRPIYLDMGDGYLHFFEIKKMYPESKCRGWGKYHERQPLLKKWQ